MDLQGPRREVQGKQNFEKAGAVDGRQNVYVCVTVRGLTQQDPRGSMSAHREALNNMAVVVESH